MHSQVLEWISDFLPEGVSDLCVDYLFLQKLRIEIRVLNLEAKDITQIYVESTSTNSIHNLKDQIVSQVSAHCSNEDDRFDHLQNSDVFIFSRGSLVTHLEQLADYKDTAFEFETSCIFLQCDDVTCFVIPYHQNFRLFFLKHTFSPRAAVVPLRCHVWSSFQEILQMAGFLTKSCPRSLTLFYHEAQLTSTAAVRLEHGSIVLWMA